MGTSHLAIAVLALTGLAASISAQSDQNSITYRSPGGTTLKVMLDDRNVGKEVALGEMVFPPNTESAEHTHGAIEMFYVVSGEYTHIVNGQAYVLKPGQAGYVKIGDKVKHKTGPQGAKTVVVWVPGLESAKLASAWKREP
jgi:quercetin dioxygenase-like cupin family protein